MSNPSPTVTIRVPPLILATVKTDLKQLSGRKKGRVVTMSEWINTAILDRLAARERSRSRNRKSSKKRPSPTSAEWSGKVVGEE